MATAKASTPEPEVAVTWVGSAHYRRLSANNLKELGVKGSVSGIEFPQHQAMMVPPEVAEVLRDNKLVPGFQVAAPQDDK